MRTVCLFTVFLSDSAPVFVDVISVISLNFIDQLKVFVVKYNVPVRDRHHHATVLCSPKTKFESLKCRTSMSKVVRRSVQFFTPP